MRGRTPTSATTACATSRSMRLTSSASSIAFVSTATAKLSRLSPASSRIAAALRGATGHRSGGPFDVGGIDVAAAHDDDVLDAAAHHDEVVLGEVADVAGVDQPVRVLRRDGAVDGEISRGDRLSTQLDHSDRALGQFQPVRATTRPSSPGTSGPSVAIARALARVERTASPPASSRSGSTRSRTSPRPGCGTETAGSLRPFRRSERARAGPARTGHRRRRARSWCRDRPARLR